MKSLICWLYSILAAFCILFLTHCSASRTDGGRLIAANVTFEFDNCCLATKIKGTGKVDVYKNKLKVQIIEGSMKINPEFDNPTYTVGDIYLSLGRYVENKNGVWTRFNFGDTLRLDQTISSLDDSLDLSGLTFEIPYHDKKELSNSWIVITTTNETRLGLNHAHSINRRQKFK